MDVDLTETNGSTLLAATWALTILSLILLALRFYCKLNHGRPLWWDDHVLAVSWVCLLGATISTNLSVSLGLGQRTAVVVQRPREDLVKLSQLSIPGSLLSVLAIVWSKTSFAITVMRICDGWKRIFLWFAILSINLFMITTGILLNVKCTPLDFILPGGPGKECLPANINVIFGTAASAYSGVMDVLLAFLPWQVVWNLQMKPGEKIGVALAMSMGIFAGVTAFIKCTYIRDLASGDLTFDLTYLMIWSVVEGGVTIIAASIPILRVLIRDATTQYYYGSKSHTQRGVRHEDESGILTSAQRGKQIGTVHSSISAHPSRSHETENYSISSDEDKVHGRPRMPSGGITRTTQVTVETQRIRGQPSSDYEMDTL